MSKRDVRLFIQDMLDAIDKVERYINSLDRGAFARNELVLDAVVRNLEVIGEAARQIPEDFRKLHPSIPWRRVVGFRNIVIHEYFAVDPDEVWIIAKEQLPALKTTLYAMLHD